VLSYTERSGWIAVLFMAVLGLSEDIKADLLSPTVRLAAQLVFMGGILFAADAYIPDSLGLPVFDYLLSIPLISWVICTIFAVGFVNAVNMADGANGLIPGITFAAFFVFASETGRMFEVGYMSACAIFLVFNVISGRFFLGDMGSYGLGAAVALYGLWFVSEGTISASFLACLLAYPCLDLLMSIFRRVIDRRSPFSPDNEHLHNRLFRQIRGRIDNPVLANSLTGLLISGATSGVTILGYLHTWWPISSNGWLIFFGAEIVLYLFVYRVSGIVKR
jgi:UDP-N-acetylmuramyl pentapeptide phosphotransferase/UDP-N-acetylglucosamine-1-phosphate transferase